MVVWQLKRLKSALKWLKLIGFDKIIGWVDEKENIILQVTS